MLRRSPYIRLARLTPILFGVSLGCSRATSPAPGSAPADGRLDESTLPFGAPVAGEVSIYWLRKADQATAIPEIAPADAMRAPRNAPPDCDGSPASHVVVTDLGPVGNEDLAREHPIAIDAWFCRASGALRYPLELSEAELSELSRRGAEAGRAGNLDEAEYFFRRLANAVPGDALTHLHIASVYLDRGTREVHGRGREAVLSQYRERIVRELDTSLRCVPPPPPVARLMLGRVFARSGEPAKARPLLEQFVSSEGITAAERQEAQELLHGLGPAGSP
jgi:hypothetical protein